jgi:hypothetical protein
MEHSATGEKGAVLCPKQDIFLNLPVTISSIILFIKEGGTCSTLL